MKRNFLLMLLLTILPFAGWAQDVQVNPEPSPVAMIDATPYLTLQAAIDAATIDDVIVLQKDITETTQVAYALGKETGGSYAIDMNGHNITAVFGWSNDPTTRHLFNLTTSDTDVTFMNSEKTGGVITGSVQNPAVYDPTTAPGGEGDISMIRVGYRDVTNCPYSSSLTIGPGVSVVSTNTMCAIDIVTNKAQEDKNVLNIYGSVSTETPGADHDYYTVGTHGMTEAKGGIINVFEGATITGADAAIYVPAGECFIKGGIITGATSGIIAKAGKLTISGGTIASTAASPVAWAWSGNGSVGVGHAVQVEQGQYPESPVEVLITGGKFVSNNKAVGSYFDLASADAALSAFLKGGNFSDDVEGFPAAGYEAVLAKDGETYDVEPSSKYELQVTPQSGVTMPYGGEIDMSPENAANVITLSSTTAPFDANLVPGLKEAIIQKLKVNGINGELDPEKWKELVPASYTYSVGLIDEADKKVVASVSVGGGEPQEYTFIIAPVSDAQVVITKAKNSLIVDEETGAYAFTLAKDAPYTGEEQPLVIIPENTKVSEFDGVEFYFTTEAPTAVDPELPEEAVFSTNIPQGTNVGNYYVWARAAEGIYCTAGDAEYIGIANIAKVKPTIAWNQDIKETYYYNPTKDADNKLVYPYQVSLEKAAIDFGTVTITPAAAQASANFYYNEKLQSGDWSNATLITDETIFAPGKTYRILVQVAKGDNWSRAFTENDDRPEFTVEYPDVTIATQADPVYVGYGVMPTFSVADPVWDEWTFNNYSKSNVTYEWFTNEDCANNHRATRDSKGNYAAGTSYWVKATGTFNVGEHTLKITPVQVYVTEGDIVAKIEDHTGDDALIYGQRLPLQLTYLDGAYAPESQAADDFEDMEWRSGFTATMIKDAEGNDVKDATPIPLQRNYGQTTILAVGTYEVSAEVANQQTSGNQVIVAPATWTVVPKNLDNSDAQKAGYSVDYNSWYTYGPNPNPYVTYNGTPQLPETALSSISYRSKTLVKNVEDDPTTTAVNEAKVNDYYVTVDGDNTHARDHQDAVKITLNGNGNFTGTKDFYFDIRKKDLPVKAAEGDWTIGGPEEYDIDWAAVALGLVETDYEAWVNEDAEEDEDAYADLKTQKGFSSLAVKRIVGSTVGVYPEGVQAYLPEGATEADDYNFTFGYRYNNYSDSKAPLEIKKGKINLKVKDLDADYAGNDFDADALEFDLELDKEGTTFFVKQDDGTYKYASEASQVLAENWKTIVDNEEKVTFALEEAAKYNVKEGGYTITATEPTATADLLRATNYEVKITGLTGTLTINPVDLKLEAKNRTFEADAFSKEGTFDEATQAAAIEGLKTVNDDAVLAVTLMGSGEGKDKVTDVVASITIEGNTITLVPAENANYNIVENEPGEWSIVPVSELTLYSEPDEFAADGTTLVGGDWKKLIDYNTLAVKTIKMKLLAPSLDGDTEEGKFSTWKADEWHAMVLPFDIKARDIALAFGYGIINVLDKENTTENNVKFKLERLQAVIPANTPFCIRTDEDYTYGTEITIGGADNENPFTIVKPELKYVSVSASDDANYPYFFAGTYEAMDIDNEMSYYRFLGHSNKWFYIKSTSSKTYHMQPYTGFVKLDENDTFTRELTFTFEEEDGSTTAIKAIDFMNGNNNANVEGLYTVDGMKLNAAPTKKGVYIQNGKKVLVK